MFIGPPVNAIQAMGSKSAAKEIMGKAGVPLVPGYHGAAQDLYTLQLEARRIGFPILIKASAGGGGKGMRIVESTAQLKDAVASAKREAASAFGDERLLLEKYLTRPRHIEMQVFADTHGNAIYLFERDCWCSGVNKNVGGSTRPRHDGGAPRPDGIGCGRAARSVGYVNAGTVEFIADEADNFYFMEMNTACGRASGDGNDYRARSGRGIAYRCRRASAARAGSNHHQRTSAYCRGRPDARLPSRCGRIQHLRQPEIRLMCASIPVCARVTRSASNDPMIAKLIAWDADRDGATSPACRAR